MIARRWGGWQTSTISRWMLQSTGSKNSKVFFGSSFRSQKKVPANILKHLGGKTPQSLTTQQKRDFARTAEPTVASARRSLQGSRRRFVIQKHASSTCTVTSASKWTMF